MSLLAEKTLAPVTGHTDSAAAFVPDQSRAERTRSYAVADFPMPTGREEDWRFTPVDRLRGLLSDAATASPVEVVLDAVEGVTLAPTTLDYAKALGIKEPADRAAAMAVARAEQPWLLSIPAETQVAGPVHVHVRVGAGETAYAHLVIEAGHHAKATIIIEHAGPGRLSEVVSTVAGDGAQLTLVSLQEWESDAQHLAQHDVVVGRDARVQHIAVGLGGAIVRVCTNASFAGPGGDFEGLGVYFADAGQHLEQRLFVDHDAPNCRSNVEYKGALDGLTARTVWVGDVLIRASAEGTETYELNRNLLLSDGARADSIPNLEIETGEIAGAGHASATGRFDDEQLFYLQARGIPEDVARRLVVRGFFASIIARIGVPEVVGHLMTSIDRELESV